MRKFFVFFILPDYRITEYGYGRSPCSHIANKLYEVVSIYPEFRKKNNIHSLNKHLPGS